MSVGEITGVTPEEGSILIWPEILPELTALAGNDAGSISPETYEGAMCAMAEICEDKKES